MYKGLYMRASYIHNSADPIAYRTKCMHVIIILYLDRLTAASGGIDTGRPCSTTRSSVATATGGLRGWILGAGIGLCSPGGWLCRQSFVTLR